MEYGAEEEDDLDDIDLDDDEMEGMHFEDEEGRYRLHPPGYPLGHHRGRHGRGIRQA